MNGLGWVGKELTAADDGGIQTLSTTVRVGLGDDEARSGPQLLCVSYLPPAPVVGMLGPEEEGFVAPTHCPVEHSLRMQLTLADGKQAANRFPTG